MKRCPHCGHTKPLTDFGRNKAAADGRAVYCKDCQSAKAKEWRSKNPDAYKAAQLRHLSKGAPPAPPHRQRLDTPRVAPTPTVAETAPPQATFTSDDTPATTSGISLELWS